jgi:hypothetical protein
MKKGKLTKNFQNLCFAILIAIIVFAVFVSCENIFIKSILPSRDSKTVKYESSDAEGKTYILVITGKTSRAAYKGAEGDSYVLTIKQQGQPDKESKGVVTTIGADGSLTLKPTKADSVPFGVSVSSGKMTAITGTITLDDGMTVPAPGEVTPIATFTSVASMAAWLKAQPANTSATPYTIKLNVNDLGGDGGTDGSAGYVLKANPTKYVYLDLSGSTITSIGEDAFSKGDFGCPNLINIIIPNSVTSIGRMAFISCGLTNVTIPNNVISIGSFAFESCQDLTSVTIGSGVTSIEVSAFGYCFQLTSVTFKGTIPSSGLENGPFGNPAGSGYLGDLLEKYLTGGPGTYTTTAPVSGSSVWTKQSGNSGGPFTSIADMDAWLSVQPDNTADTAYTVKLNVSDLGGNRSDSGSAGYVLIANNYTKYVGLDLSDGTITTIVNSAFYTCTSLTSVIIPTSVTTIEAGAFDACDNLISVTFQSTITEANFNSTETFLGDLREKYLAGGPGTYTTTAPVEWNSVWTKKK